MFLMARTMLTRLMRADANTTVKMVMRKPTAKAMTRLELL